MGSDIYGAVITDQRRVRRVVKFYNERGTSEQRTICAIIRLKGRLLWKERRCQLAESGAIG